MQIGTRLGRYEILAPLGKGGMGEVYRARDRSVGRDIAIKLLPDDMLADADRLQRLRREARLLASLNHPNIASLYAFEEEQGVSFLVLELVEGDTLASRLNQGRMPLRAVLPVAVQIADALAAVHGCGLVHRDLKPSNVMLTPGGGVKLLDFGIARRDSRDPDSTTRSRDFETTTSHIAGTPAYMSPERARGLPADERSDIWAFGCVLYESLTGQHPFPAPTTSDQMAAILERDPDWGVLDGCPAKVRDLVKRCLRKDLAERLHHIADARIELQEALAEPLSGEALPLSRPQPIRRKAAGLASVGLGLFALGFLLRGCWGAVPLSEPVRRFGLDIGTKLAFGPDYPATVAISPRGDLVAYVAEGDGERRIHLRAMDEINSRPLDGTVGAQQPFFSPDGKWLGFFAGGQLQKVSLRGGAPIGLCAAPNGRGGAWSPEGWIVFAPSNPSGLWRVSENGGQAEVFSRVRSEAGEHAHWSPILLADQRTVLFTVYTGRRNTDSRLAIQAPGEADHRIVLEGGSHGRWLPPHWLVYGRGTELIAVEFDPERGAVTGTPFRVLDGIQDTPIGAPLFTVSDQGTLIYATAVVPGNAGRVLWLDRSGQVREEVEAGAACYRPRLSPDGNRVAFHLADPDFNVWTKDLARGTRSKLTKDPGYDGFGVWSPDGRQIAFSSARDGSRTLFVQAADGSGTAERLLEIGNARWPTSWSPNGDWLAFNEEDPRTGAHVWLLDMRTRRAQPLLRTSGHEAWARFSPDGEWLAYHSDESGSFEVYVRSVRDPSRHVQVSAGGMGPIWSPTGNQIYYNHGAQFIAVPLRLGKSPEVGRPQVLFATDMEINDVNARGDRFLAVDAPISVSISRLEVVLGWPRVLAQLAEGR